VHTSDIILTWGTQFFGGKCHIIQLSVSNLSIEDEFSWGWWKFLNCDSLISSD